MRLRHSDHTGDMPEHHEINVTPFIDVILVLLIVFMIAAPLATADIPVNLPTATAKPHPSEQDPLFLTIQANHEMSLDDQPVTPASLAKALDKATGSNHDRRIYLRADKAVDYGRIMHIMDLLRRAGYLRIALVGLESGQGT